jgi:hypothetical protein
MSPPGGSGDLDDGGGSHRPAAMSRQRPRSDAPSHHRAGDRIDPRGRADSSIAPPVAATLAHRGLLEYGSAVELLPA